jgi:hypothetical protein
VAEKVWFGAQLDPALKRVVKQAALNNDRTIREELDAVLRAHYGIPTPRLANGKSNGNGKAKAGRKPSGVAKARPAAREAITA